jgi:hypothetical protein
MQILSKPLSRYHALELETRLVNRALDAGLPILNKRRRTVSEMLGGFEWLGQLFKPFVSYTPGAYLRNPALK